MDIDDGRDRETTYLTGRSGLGINTLVEGINTLVEGVDISTQDVHFHILVARLQAKLSVNDRDLFAEIMKRLQQNRIQSRPKKRIKTQYSDWNVGTYVSGSAGSIRRLHYCRAVASAFTDHALASHSCSLIEDQKSNTWAGANKTEFSRGLRNKLKHSTRTEM